jgi:RNA polymerase nonessential primary-like sigma factor
MSECVSIEIDIDRKLLIEENISLVYFVASRYKWCGIEFEELVQIGFIGLIKSANKFDPYRGTAFSTYAIPCIESEIKNEIRNINRNIRIPYSLFKKILQYKKVEMELHKELIATPSYIEIMESLDIHLDELNEIITYKDDTLSIEYLKETGELLFDGELIDYIINENSIVEDVRRFLNNSNLTELEYIVIVFYFGLFGYECLSLQQIAEHPMVSPKLPSKKTERRRIQQIKESALKKLKRSGEINKLAEYMDEPELAIYRIEKERLENAKICQERYSMKVRRKYINNKR